jgi:hypothetical protein
MSWDGRDPDLLVDLAIAGRRDELRALLRDEAARYRSFAPHSPLVLAIADAYAILQAMPDQGPFDDLHPRWALFHTCPHPLADGMGYCQGCGADTSLAVDPLCH